MAHYVSARALSAIKNDNFFSCCKLTMTLATQIS